MASTPNGAAVSVCECYDCGWIGNRPEVHENYQEGWEEPWTALFCPECGEHTCWRTARFEANE